MRVDRPFRAVVRESIERIARVAQFSIKVGYELEQAGVARLAADEGIDRMPPGSWKRDRIRDAA